MANIIDHGLHEPGHSISYKIAHAHSEDSDQPAHPRSLISLRRALGVQPRNQGVFMRTANTLISLRGCAG